ncbi:hypothetical protein [Jiangella anatolica]|uniref:Prokaryotic metallothionein n=1 Tax=Jiangella anatolica TaxID=2670374 RepID=A0A2W2BGH6_9ACTN|nr:hypothetical protein [Jiangella anatolica]PZF86305.1 hypothetical protein C1I92_02110 [Jiangella anatolica]
MNRCDVCGNEYRNAFTLRTADGQELVFDSFECAIHRCAPACAHCGCKVIGHGIQAGEQVYCCAHCAQQSGVTSVADNADHALT